MFVGAIPIECIEQLAKVMPVEDWRLVYSCCSGSFRADGALGQRFPQLSITSNDVSLLSCAIGKLAVGDSIEVTFKERLAFVEDAIGQDPHDRVAAVMMAFAMSKFKGNNDFARKHFAHFQEHFAHYVERAKERLLKRLDSIRITGFNACDFREHAREGLAKGAAIIAFPPTYKKGYETMYRFLDQNVSWNAPTYELWEPKLLPAWLDEIDAAGGGEVGGLRGLPHRGAEARLGLLLRDEQAGVPLRPGDPRERPSQDALGGALPLHRRHAGGHPARCDRHPRGGDRRADELPEGPLPVEGDRPRLGAVQLLRPSERAPRRRVHPRAEQVRRHDDGVPP